MDKIVFPPEKLQKYQGLMHALQSGVASFMHYDRQPTEPKHLRVGVNSALIETTAIVEILIEKGIITPEEYLDKLIACVEREVADYERRLSQLTGANITLG